LFWLMICHFSIAENNNANRAEYERLSHEMEKMSKHNVWKGVDKRFQDMEKLNVQISFEDYVLGAQASQEIGDILNCKKRLALAIEIKKKKQLVKWYQNIDEKYGYVALFTSSKGGRYLSIDSMIDGPVESQAIAFASEKIINDGEFEGLLPKGSYDFVGQKFKVSPGIAVHLEISPRMRKKTNISYDTFNE
jgi:hypothetical protein